MSEFIWVTVLGIGIAAVVRYALPRRDTYGIVLLPALGGVIAAAAWASVTWAGWKSDSPWPWLLALGAAALVSVGAALITSRARTAGDAKRLHHLSGGRA